MSLTMSSNIPDYDVLGPKMSKAFYQLHDSIQSGQPPDVEAFEKASFEYFNNTQKAGDHDIYFNRFTILWQLLMYLGNFREAERIWELPNGIALKWEQLNPKRKLHKGTLYFFWSATALQLGDLDKAFLILHQALEEDRRTHNNRYPDTPAFEILTLDYKERNTSVRSLLQELASFLNERLEPYRSSCNRQLTMDEFQSRFLKDPDIMDTLIFFFTYTLARFYKVNNVPEHLRQSPFSGQLKINLLFDLARIIDYAIKVKNPTQWQFYDHIKFLINHPQTGPSSFACKFGELHLKFKDDFEGTLKELVNGRLFFDDGTKPPIELRDLAIAYEIRNRSAHDLSSITTIWERFEKIQQSLFNALFLTVEVLY